MSDEIEDAVIISSEERAIIEAPEAPQAGAPYVGNADFETRAAVLKALANQAGMRLPDTRLPEGTALLAVGEENKRRMACEVAQLPDAGNGLKALAERVKAERAADIEVPMGMMRMDPMDKRIYGLNAGPGAPRFGYTHQGASQLMAYAKPDSVRNGFAENVHAMPPKLAAEWFNHCIENRRGEGPAIIRTVRTVNDVPLIRAVTSERHSLTTGDDLTVLRGTWGLSKGAKLRATRQAFGERTELEFLWPAMERELRVGDVAMLGIRITNSETKGGALRVEPCILRVLCYNFTTAWSEGLDEEFTLRHVGDLSRKLPRILKRAHETLEPFIHAFADAYKTPMQNTSRGELIEKVLRWGKLPMSLGEGISAAWDMDGFKSAGNTLAGLAHAMTRASQAQEVSAAAETEKVAGKLVMRGWGALVN